MEKEETINGTVEDIIYNNSENGYTVFSVENDGDEVVCVGTLPKAYWKLDYAQHLWPSVSG